MNKRKLEAVMKLHGDTAKTLCKYIGLSRTRFSCKINEKGGAEFTQSEISKIKEKYNLSPGDIDDIFFDQIVS